MSRDAPIIIPRPAGGTWADLLPHERATVAAYARYGGPIGSEKPGRTLDVLALHVRLGRSPYTVKNDLSSAARRLGLEWRGWINLVVWAWGQPSAMPLARAMTEDDDATG